MVNKEANESAKQAFIKALSEELQRLPGYEAQTLMEPTFRNPLELDSSNAKQAATMLLLYHDVEWKFILIKRSSHPLDKHKGQVSFPGGSIETEESPAEAAIRESYEEINIQADNIEMLGAMSSLFIPVSNFLVYPFVGLANMQGVQLQKQESEVSEILHISLREFMLEETRSTMDMVMVNGMTVKDVPYYTLENKVVWGATAMMLSEFREICKRIV